MTRVSSPSDIPYRFDVTASVADVIAAHPDVEAGTETSTVVTVAGRLMLRRDQGKLVFGVLQDATGRVQLFATARATPDFERFADLSLGDWIGVTGVVMATKRGELSVRVDEWVVLARTRRPFPDKWHGITDPDVRYRQRYVDLWVSDRSRENALDAIKDRLEPAPTTRVTGFLSRSRPRSFIRYRAARSPVPS